MIKFLTNDCKYNFNAKDNNSISVLAHAIKSNPSVDVIKFFYEKDKCRICTNSDDDTILSLAVENQSLEVVKYLVRENFNSVHDLLAGGKTLLMHAV